MPESTSTYRKQPLKNLSDAPRDDLEDVIKNLVENGHVSATVINEELGKVRAKNAAAAAKDAAEDAAEAAKTTGEIAKVTTKISETVAQTGSKSGSEKPGKIATPEAKPAIGTTSQTAATPATKPKTGSEAGSKTKSGSLPESKLKPQPEKAEKVLSPEAREKLLQILKLRFTMNRRLHEKTRWADVERALRANPEAMWSLDWMEKTGGEPDVIDGDIDYYNRFKFVDCSKESPWGRKNVVFNREGEEYLKKHSPDEMCNGNAEDIAEKHGVIIMDSETYKDLQKKLKLDLNSSSWLRENRTSYYYRPMLGSYYNDAVHLVVSNTDNHEPTRSFRAILGVLVVGKDENSR